MNEYEIYKQYSKDIIFLIDHNGIIITMNDAALEFFKVKEGELLGKELSSYLQLIKLPLFPSVESLNNTKSYPIVDLFYRHQINNLLYIFSIHKHNKSNNNIHYVFCGNEVNETNLKNINFSTIIDNFPGALYWKDKKGRYIGCNSFVLKMAGFSEKNEIIGKTDYELCWAEYADEWRSADLEVMRTGKEIVKEEFAKLANGEIIIELTHKAPLKNKQGEIIGLIGTSLDITEKKQLENKLVEAKKQAEFASKAKSGFIANMSHDIRTPITGILGLAHSIRDTTKNINLKQDAVLLIKTTEELLIFVNEILEFSSLENNIHEIKNEIFSIKNVVKHNIDLLKVSAKHKGIKLDFAFGTNFPNIVKGNKIYLDRIILNLLSNAIKFTHKGGVNILLDHRVHDKNSVNIKITVKDTGIGIPKDKFKMIFENFSRLTPSYEGIYKGSGLGLFMVKQYLGVMGGKVSLTSKEGKGSAFVVDVPFQPIDEQPVGLTNNILKTFPDKNNDGNIFNIKSNFNKIIANILIVEDNPLAARMVAQIIQKCNCAYSIASDSKETLKLLSNKKFDLIFIDIGLPDISGFELSRKIREIPNGGLIPIIALTGHFSLDNEKKCLHSGMQAMYSKPISLIAVKNVIYKYCLGCTDSNILNIKTKENKLTNLPTLNLEQDFRLTRNDIKNSKFMISELLATLPNDIQELYTLEENCNIEKLSQFVHKFYGGLCYCGVPRLQALTKQFNESLNNGIYHSIKLQIDAIAKEADLVIKQGREFLKN